MTTGIAYQLFANIFHTFGRQAPAHNSPFFSTLLDNVSDLPDECAGYIFQRVKDLDSLPQNLSKFFYSCWEQWKAENPNAIYREACQTCGGTGGWYYLKRIQEIGGETRMHDFFSPCPSCTWIPPRLREKIRPSCKTPRDLKAEGCIVMPHGYEGGVAKFIEDSARMTA